MPSGGFDDQEQGSERHQSATLPPDGDLGSELINPLVYSPFH
jgi:hypothetical protein